MKGEFPDEGKVLGGVALPRSGAILKESHVEVPMEQVLNAPMSTGKQVVVGRFWESHIADVVA